MNWLAQDPAGSGRGIYTARWNAGARREQARDRGTERGTAAHRDLTGGCRARSDGGRRNGQEQKQTGRVPSLRNFRCEQQQQEEKKEERNGDYGDDGIDRSGVSGRGVRRGDGRPGRTRALAVARAERDRMRQNGNTRGMKVREKKSANPPPPFPRRLRAIHRQCSPTSPTGQRYAGKSLAAPSGYGTLADRTAVSFAIAFYSILYNLMRSDAIRRDRAGCA